MNDEKILKAASVITTIGTVGGILNVLLQSGLYENFVTGLRHEDRPKNTYGYDDYSCLKVKQNNFMVLNIGGKNDFIEMLNIAKRCNKEGISCAVVLHSNATDLGEFYGDIDLLQTFCQNCEIDLPIYLSIDEIMTNVNLNNAQKETLISAFITKCSASRMYVGLSGTDTNLANCDEYIMKDDISIRDYDTYLLMDHETKEGEDYQFYYQGAATLKKSTNGEISATYNLADAIASKGLNKNENQVLSAYYTLQEGETIETVALKYGLSINDILYYNNTTLSKAAELKVIKIPNMYATVNKETNTRNYSYAVARGIDVSHNQGNMDWERIKSSSDFIIMRVTSGKDNSNNFVGSLTNLDRKLEENIINANANGIPYGFYFTVDKKISTDDFKERFEARLRNCDEIFTRNAISVDRSTIPLFIDFEYYSEENDYYQIMESASKIATDYGYKVIGLYANKSVTKSINNNMKNRHNIELTNTAYPIWLAGGKQYLTSERNIDGFTLDQLEEPTNDTNAAMLQITNACKDTGASDANGNCDVNYLYTDGIFQIQEQENPQLDEVTLKLEDYEDHLNHIANKLSNLATVPVALAVLVTGLKVRIEQLRYNRGYIKSRKRTPNTR